MEKYKKYAIPVVVAVIVLAGLFWFVKAKKSNDDGAREIPREVEVTTEEKTEEEKTDVVFVNHNICKKNLSAPVINVNGVDIVARVFSLETAGTSTAFCNKMTLVPDNAVLSAYLNNTSRDGITWQLLINNMEYSVNVLTEDINKISEKSASLLGKLK